MDALVVGRRSCYRVWARAARIVAVCLLVAWNVPASAQEDLTGSIFSSSDTELASLYPDQLSPVPGTAPDPGVMNPPPTDQQALRIQALENQVQNLRQGLLSGELTPGRLRSTDIAPPKPAAKAPTTFPTVKLTGFFQADAGWISQDANGIVQFGDINDSQGFRRARLAAVGDLAKNVGYLLEMDFAQPGRPSFQDVWLDLHNVEFLGNVRVGQWRQPFGMDALTSVRELMFLERALPFAFVPFRQIGIGFHDNNEDQTVTWAGSAFGFPTDTFGDHIGDGGYGLCGRVTALPYFENDGEELIHVGCDYCLERPTGSSLRYRNVPEFAGPFGGPTGTAGTLPFFVDTGAMAARSSNLFNAEIAAVLGSFYAQSEVTYAVVDLSGAGRVTFPGFYAQAAYLLTGEVRPYNKVGGVLGRVKPRCPWGEDGFGAWEVAARYSYMDLNQGPITGGRISNATAGLNWYLNQNAKFQFNYIWSDLNNTPGGHSITDIYAVRAQIDF